MICSRWSLSRKTTSDLSILPAFSTKIFFGPVDQDVADLVVLEQQLERAEAEGLVEDLVDEPLALDAVEQRVLGVAQVLDDPADLARSVLGSISLTRFRSSRSTSRMWMWRLSVSYWLRRGSGSFGTSPCAAAPREGAAARRLAGGGAESRGASAACPERAARPDSVVLAPGDGVRTGLVQVL